MRTKWTGLSLVLLSLAALFSTACSEISLGTARDDVRKSFRVEPGGNLVLDSDLGSVEVSSGITDEVQVVVERGVRGATIEEAEQTLRRLDLDFRQEGKNVYIRASYPTWNFFAFNWGHRLQLRFMITVPNKYNLDLKTGGGSISVADLQGAVLARTSGGSLRLGRIDGSVRAHTSGGNIAVEGGSGPLEVDTSGGSIRIGKVNGTIRAHSSGGNISVNEVQGTIRASTSGGHVDATITRQPEGDCELTTSGGSINVRLSRNLNLNLLAKTSGGSVRTDIPVTLQGAISRSRVEAKLNGGGPQLLLHTSGGSISINEIP
jgi:DUF4097 and DUF4098 domain-containing protein YvlB